MLLEHGADPTAPTKGGFTPLDAAEGNGDAELAELLRHALDVPPPDLGG
jgi:ankyrin repeat protein